MINVRVCCGLSVGIYTPSHLHRSGVTPRYAVVCRFPHDLLQGNTQGLTCHAGSHLVCTWHNPGSHPDMLWSVGLHMIYSGVTPRDAVVCAWYRVTPRVWLPMRDHIWFAHDIIQGHTQICCGMLVWAWFTPESHQHMLWPVSIKLGNLNFQLLQTVSYTVSRDPAVHKRNRHLGVLCIICRVDEFLFKIYCYYVTISVNFW